MAVSDTAAMLLTAVYIIQGFLDSLPGQGSEISR